MRDMRSSRDRAIRAVAKPRQDAGPHSGPMPVAADKSVHLTSLNHTNTPPPVLDDRQPEVRADFVTQDPHPFVIGQDQLPLVGPDGPTFAVTAPTRDYARPQQPIRRVTPTWVRRYTLTVVLLDLLVATLAGPITISAGHLPRSGTLTVLTFPVLWVMVLALGRTYEARFVGAGTDEYRRLFTSSVVLLAVIGSFGYAAIDDLARQTVVIVWTLAVLLSLLVHFVSRQVLHHLRRGGACLRRVLVVGHERSVAELIRTVSHESHAGFAVVAACVDRARSGTVEGVPVLGHSDSMVSALLSSGADTIAVAAWSDVSQTDLRRLSWDLEGSGVSLLVAPRLVDVSGPRIHFQPVAGLPLINVEEPEFTGARRFVKVATDRLGAAFALLVLSPFFVALAVCIRLTSPGPIFFQQVRVGSHAEPFVMHKFRTMYVDAEHRLVDLLGDNDSDGPLFKMKNDPRLTPVGRWLRRFSLDELPQLLDVLTGRMSLVGPRPPLPSEVNQYPLHLRRRLIVKPGVTGLWQVSGRSDLSWDESVRLDLYYVENWSLPLDLAIMAKTILAVARGSGAY